MDGLTSVINPVNVNVWSIKMTMLNVDGQDVELSELDTRTVFDLVRNGYVTFDQFEEWRDSVSESAFTDGQNNMVESGFL